MGPMRYILVALAVGLTGHVALAFEESTIGAGDRKAPGAQVLEPSKTPADTAKGLNLGGQGLHLGQSKEFEVRIPGFGSVGKLPKVDFGLELLYGANDQKGPLQDKTSPDDVQLRGTIKLPIN